MDASPTHRDRESPMGVAEIQSAISDQRCWWSVSTRGGAMRCDAMRCQTMRGETRQGKARQDETRRDEVMQGREREKRARTKEAAAAAARALEKRRDRTDESRRLGIKHEPRPRIEISLLVRPCPFHPCPRAKYRRCKEVAVWITVGNLVEAGKRCCWATGDGCDMMEMIGYNGMEWEWSQMRCQL